MKGKNSTTPKKKEKKQHPLQRRKEQPPLYFKITRIYLDLVQFDLLHNFETPGRKKRNGCTTPGRRRKPAPHKRTRSGQQHRERGAATHPKERGKHESQTTPCDFITQRREGVGGKGCISLKALFFLETFSCCIFRSLIQGREVDFCCGQRLCTHDRFGFSILTATCCPTTRSSTSTHVWTVEPAPIPARVVLGSTHA